MTLNSVAPLASGIAGVFAFHVNDKLAQCRHLPNTELDPLKRVFCPVLAQRLARLRLSNAAFQVLALAPLSYAAWSGGTLSSSKRERALEAASRMGIETDSMSYQILEDWLHRRPDPILISFWYDHVGGLKWVLSEKSIGLLLQTTLDRAEAILTATSSSFGIGQISRNDQMVLNTLKSAF